MEHYSSDSFMVAWNHENKTIKVGPWPDRTGWSAHLLAEGCHSAYFREQPLEKKSQLLVNLLVHLVLGYGLNPIEIHREFMKIDVWREMDINLPSGRFVAHYNGRWSPHNP